MHGEDNILNMLNRMQFEIDDMDAKGPLSYFFFKKLFSLKNSVLKKIALKSKDENEIYTIVVANGKHVPKSYQKSRKTYCLTGKGYFPHNYWGNVNI